ncbi:MAG: chemotaxis-specific protein-glutamate methyltransferase CheB [Sporolactobacillus sp.]|jgi:two-component system chemotaxis response regulator CheB|nr:chemotaxis-specific protein-glutamate methyltransferase CheB [Sporolactobacillus sp.]
MNDIRVMIVDDSAFMRLTLKAMIEEDPFLKVVATARNGSDALTKLDRFHPDVITLDILLTGNRDGLAVLREIMAVRPTPTIMVSGAGGENAVIEALGSGAFDFIAKPNGRPSEIGRIESELQTKIRQAAETKIRPDAAHPDQTADGEIEQKTAALSRMGFPSLIFIGTSTGGPKALQLVVPGLKIGLPAPILIVQHMPAQFTKSLADRLDRMSRVKVSEAFEGEVLENGNVYIAPGGFHTRLLENENGRLVVRLSQDPPVHGVRPSVDVALNSLDRIRHRSYVVAILTGMGKDGASGLSRLKKSNRHVFAIAEARQSCVVFGMPKAAIETKQVDLVCPLGRVAESICSQYAFRGDE